MAADRRLAALRSLYPAPTPVAATERSRTKISTFEPNIPVALRYLVFRQREADGGALFPVDPLFPGTLEGRADMSSIDEGSAALLYGLVRALAPRVVLETGTHKGRSTRALATALRDAAEVVVTPHSFTMTMPSGHLWTVDAEDHQIFASGAIPPEAQRFVTPLHGWTPDVFQTEPLASLQGIQFAFLDGDHSAEGLDAELTYVDLHRAAECWVAIDNTRDPFWPGVARTLHDYTRYPRISLPTCTGMDLIWMHDARSPRAETA